MTYIVKDECIKCKLTDCVEVCPVDCFYEGENFLAINPDECIDCGVCEPECPIDAIKADTDESVPDMEKWLLINTKFSALWPNISKKKDPMEEHEKYKNINSDKKALLTLMGNLGNERDRLGKALKLTTLSSGDYELLRDEKKTFGGTRVKKTNGDSDEVGLRLLA